MSGTTSNTPKVERWEDMGTGTSSTYPYTVTVDCPYINSCASYPHRCSSCKHNKARKKDHYKDKLRYVG